MQLNCKKFYKILKIKNILYKKLFYDSTPDVETREEALKLCNNHSKIYKLAEKYCKKDSECSSPSLEIINN